MESINSLKDASNVRKNQFIYTNSITKPDWMYSKTDPTLRCQVCYFLSKIFFDWWHRRISNLGACHGDELGYLFQTPFALGTSLTCEESICRNRVLSAWTSFARDGNPNVKKWAPITKISDLKYAEFKRGLGEIDCSQSFPNRDRVKLWQTLYGEHVATKLWWCYSIFNLVIVAFQFMYTKVLFDVFLSVLWIN